MNKSVRSYLIELARHRTNQTIHYQNLSDACLLNLNMDNPNDRNVIGSILGEISRFEYKYNRPLLSALVIRAGDNYEGNGFYKLGEELGFGKWEQLKREGVFEVQQMTKCINFWTNDENYRLTKDV